MADITVYAGLAFADFVELDIPAGCEALRAWRDRVAARPATVAAAAA
jgi:glutathione S-transferase